MQVEMSWCQMFPTVAALACDFTNPLPDYFNPVKDHLLVDLTLLLKTFNSLCQLKFPGYPLKATRS